MYCNNNQISTYMYSTFNLYINNYSLSNQNDYMCLSKACIFSGLRIKKSILSEEQMNYYICFRKHVVVILNYTDGGVRKT